jgi:hypothetical protein
MERIHRDRPRRLLVPAAAFCLAVQALTTASPAQAFTADNHDKVTLDAVAFGPATAEQVRSAVKISDAGPRGNDSRAHCDNADYLTTEDHEGVPYPRSRTRADRELQSCAQYAYENFVRAVSAADGMVDSAGKAIPEQVADRTCAFDEGPDRKKCEVLDGLGRSWHAIEDFYSHSNYADKHDPAIPVGRLNPPGLALLAPAPLFDMAAFRKDWAKLNILATFSADLDPRLTTGCFHNDEDSQGYRNDDCVRGSSRVTHQDDDPHSGYPGNGVGLAKDSNAYQRARLTFSDEGGGRTNLEQVMAQATSEIKHQWALFHDALVSQYGRTRADGMVEAIVTDHPAGG